MKRRATHELQRIIMAARGEPRRAIEFMAYTGARVSEAIAVCAKHVDPILGIVRIYTLKNPKHPIRKLKIDVAYAGRLISGKYPDDRLFPVTRQAVWKGMKKAAKRSKVDTSRAYPHAVRHSFAYQKSKEGCHAI